MSLGKQAKPLTKAQIEAVLGYLAKTRHPVRNKLIFFLSIRAGIRAREIALLEHFPTGMNRLGFPKRRESDSSWMLAREVSMHDQGAFR